ncbi:MAG: heme-binding protein [Chromatiales bacterium]|nr:heme-binding protein [Gammaproteobacteria bacterium]MCP5230788.1 heme-binding protein [Zoogloeaceae bacterium]MCP5351914.1 heme-binding protein [Chromatiales bacterium]
MRNIVRSVIPLITAAAMLPMTASAEDVITKRFPSLELAMDAAKGAVDACREAGYQVSAVVVDKSAITQVVLRDALAARFTMRIAEDKANAVIMSGVSSADFVKNRADIKDEMNEIDGVLMLAGGLPIRAAGSIIGAIGVSGAPGGEKDEECAAKGIEKIQERLDFAE